MKCEYIAALAERKGQKQGASPGHPPLPVEKCEHCSGTFSWRCSAPGRWKGYRRRRALPLGVLPANVCGLMGLERL